MKTIQISRQLCQLYREEKHELALRQAAAKPDKKALSAIEKNMEYLKKCNKELLDMIGKQER